MPNSVEVFKATWLDATNNRGYGPLPIPIERDHEIFALIRRWIALNRDERREACSHIDEMKRLTLLAFSERMASYAVRAQDLEIVQFGLLATGLDGWRHEWRENTALLRLHFDAAKKLGAAPQTVFADAARMLSTEAGQALLSFTKRKPEDQTIQTMGYVESSDDGGFRYKRTW